MARFRFIVFVALQIVVVKSYPFQDDAAGRNVDQSEPNSMNVDLNNLMNAANNAQQNLDALINEIPNKDKSDQAQETPIIPEEQNQGYEVEDNDDGRIGSLSEQNAERERGEYKEEENLGNSHVFEGDIYKDKSTTKILDLLQNGAARDAITNALRLWPGGRVPYVFGNANSKLRTAFRQAIADYNKYTCIRIVPRRSERNYIRVFSGGGCWSSIGKSGGMQKLSLGKGCEHKGTAIHELMHAIGFFHEQSRLDRDNYITIHWNNIRAGVEYNFKKYGHGQADTLNEPYDYASVMHYPKWAFTKNGRDTITTKTSGAVIGNRKGFSRIDIRQINKLYKCGVVPTRKPVVKCVDARSACPRWAKKGYCASGPYIQYVKKRCRKSCKLCKGTVNPVTAAPNCVDKKNGCSSWARAGYCKRKFVRYMTRYCPKSCNKC